MTEIKPDPTNYAAVTVTKAHKLQDESIPRATIPTGDGSNVLSLNAYKAKQDEERALDAGVALAAAANEQRLEKLMRARHMLFAILRAEGRVRIKRTDLEAVVQGRDRIDVKAQENGDLIVSFLEG